MKSLRKKLFLSILAVAFAVISLATSTFAWFSMNNKVTVTGMVVTTKVSNNLLIADDTLASTAKKGDAYFSNSLVQQQDALLEPVSTTNGKNFFFTPNSNVKADGDAVNETYTAYNAAEVPTSSELTAFETNYSGADGAVGYVDYVFQLKAVNSEAAAAQIRLTKLELTYGGTADASKAQRIAMFVEDITSAAPAGGSGSLVTIFTPSGAANFESGKAVTSTSATGAVTYCANTTTAKIDVAASTTKYFKVVFRLWLEGEDNTCNNETFMSLSDKWSLDLEMKLVLADNAVDNAVQYINKNVTAAKVELTIGTDNGLDEGAVVINGVTYYPISGKTLSTKQLYVSGNKTLAANSHIFTIDSTYPTEVTNQVSIVPAP